MTDDHNSPSAFVASWIAKLAVRLPASAKATAGLAEARARSNASEGGKADTTDTGLRSRRALDVAMGRGRHALLLARHGFRAFGVDVKCDAVRDAVLTAARDGLIVRGWCADLTASPIPAGCFDVVVVARYLQRDLFDALKASLAPGGCIIYETFTVAQLAHGVGPKSPDHLLRPGELQSLFADWDVLFYEEVDEPEAVARLVAQRPLSD